MSKSITFILSFLILPISIWATKYGALAVDKNNGSYYGWAYDYSNKEEAKHKAFYECTIKGGNCSVVMEFSGLDRCAAYSSNNKDISAWAKAPKKVEARFIASYKCLKASNDKECLTHNEVCNSKETKKSTKELVYDYQKIANKIASYYDIEGEFSGEFIMSNILDMKIKPFSMNIIKVNVKYKYKPVHGNKRPSGFDHRTFTLIVTSKSYIVISMGKYMSGESNN